MLEIPPSKSVYVAAGIITTQIEENEVFTFTNVSTHTSNRVLIGAAVHLGDAGSLVHAKGNLMKFVMSDEPRETVRMTDCRL